MSTSPNGNDSKRCAWAQTDPIMREYHDQEWGMPEFDSRALWELLMLEGFQAGLSWIVVLRKREAFRRAFANFDPDLVAKFAETDVERLMADAGIVRARAKISATIRGAQIYVEMRESGTEFGRWAWDLVGGQPIRNSGAVLAQTELAEKVSKELKHKGFKFVGPVIVYAWMQAAGMVNDHAKDCFRRQKSAEDDFARTMTSPAKSVDRQTRNQGTSYVPSRTPFIRSRTVLNRRLRVSSLTPARVT